MRLMHLFEVSHAEVIRLADKFKVEYEGKAGTDAFGANLKDLHCEGGNCAMISNEFHSWLKKQGIKADDISGEDPTNPKWNDGDKGFYPSDDPPPAVAAHTATRIGSWVVDFNARQFDKKLPYPRIMTVGDFDEEWKHVT